MENDSNLKPSTSGSLSPPLNFTSSSHALLKAIHMTTLSWNVFSNTSSWRKPISAPIILSISSIATFLLKSMAFIIPADLILITAAFLLSIKKMLSFSDFYLSTLLTIVQYRKYAAIHRNSLQKRSGRVGLLSASSRRITVPKSKEFHLTPCFASLKRWRFRSANYLKISNPIILQRADAPD